MRELNKAKGTCGQGVVKKNTPQKRWEDKKKKAITDLFMESSKSIGTCK